MATNSISSLRQELNSSGCAFGQVNRERLAHVVEATEAVEQKLNYVLAAIGAQLLGFVFSVLLFLLSHFPTH